jgi:RimJ/RimL family protein N-acetyltransferase
VPIPELRTDRLLLRAWLERDRAPYRAMNADPEVMRHFPNPLDATASDAMLESLTPPWERDGIGGWIVERAEDGAFLGVTGFSRPSFDPRPFAPEFEIGWRYARTAWGHGYATEAAGAALAFGFETVGLDEIVSFTVPANERSWHVMERLGMHRDPADDFDHPRLPEGHHLRRHVLYRLRADEWRALRHDAGRAGSRT